MISDDTKLVKLIEKRNRDKMILYDNEVSYRKGINSKYTSEQIEDAQNEVAKKEINKLYNERIFPYSNAIIYLVYCLGTLLTLPLVYYGKMFYVAIIFYLLIAVALFVSRYVEINVRSNIEREHRVIVRLIRFSDQSGIFSYILTSVGYLICFFTFPYFLVFYIVMWVLFIMTFFYEVILPDTSGIK